MIKRLLQKALKFLGIGAKVEDGTLPDKMLTMLSGNHSCMDCAIAECPISKLRGWDVFPFAYRPNNCEYYYPIVYAYASDHHPDKAWHERIMQHAKEIAGDE